MNGSHISLFSGVGMLDHAAEALGFETVLTAEIDPFCRRVLEARFPSAFHFDDVRKLTRADDRDHFASSPGYQALLKRPLLVSGGFPCQPVSLAGYGLVEDDPRWLWPEFRRVIAEFQPEYVLIENVAALRNRGGDKVLTDLNRLGYDAWWDCIPAAAVGAPHMRDRIWIQARRRDQPRIGGDAGDAFAYAGVTRLSRYEPYGDPVGRLPRAGRMIDGEVYEEPPRATQRQVKAAVKDGDILFPSPSAQEPGWRGFPVVDKHGKRPSHPNQRFHHAETGRVVQKGVEQVAKLFPEARPAFAPLLTVPTESGLFPTPTRSDGAGGPGTTPKRTGGKNLRTVVAELEGNGRLNPAWVEWLMGLPFGWTAPGVDNEDLIDFPGWHEEPLVPRTTARGGRDRAARIKALGNGAVPQVAAHALSELLERP